MSFVLNKSDDSSCTSNYETMHDSNHSSNHSNPSYSSRKVIVRYHNLSTPRDGYILICKCIYIYIIYIHLIYIYICINHDIPDTKCKLYTHSQLPILPHHQSCVSLPWLDASWELGNKARLMVPQWPWMGTRVKPMGH